MFVGAENRKTVDHLSGRCPHGGISRMSENAHTTIYCMRTGGPPVLSVLIKPAMGWIVMHMRRIEKGYQDVDVEQRNTHS
jgi:hypothetical protein